MINRFKKQENFDNLYELIELNQKNVYLNLSIDPIFRFFFIKQFKYSKEHKCFIIKGLNRITKKQPWIFFKIVNELNEELYSDELTKVSLSCEDYMIIPGSENIDYNIIENDTFFWMPQKVEIFEKILNMEIKKKDNSNCIFGIVISVLILFYLIISFILSKLSITKSACLKLYS